MAATRSAATRKCAGTAHTDGKFCEVSHLGYVGHLTDDHRPGGQTNATMSSRPYFPNKGGLPSQGGVSNASWRSVVLDKLVAVHMDLEPLCGTTAARAHIVATPQGIAEACDILHAAIADVRDIVCQIEGLTEYLPGSVSAALRHTLQ